jgi:hypothetical protein
LNQALRRNRPRSARGHQSAAFAEGQTSDDQRGPAPSPDKEWPGTTVLFGEVQAAMPTRPVSVFTESGEMK